MDQPSAVDMDLGRLGSLFGIHIPERKDLVSQEWRLPEEPYDVPADLVRNLEKMSRADYGTISELSTRLGLGLLILECNLALIDAYPHLFNRAPSTPGLNIFYATPRVTVPAIKTVLEFDLSVSVNDRWGKPVEVTGRADWAYLSTSSDFPTFIAIEAKRPQDFSTAYLQLLTNLAIIHEHDLQIYGQETAVHGFYTDGVQYRFMMISSEGKVSQSRIYDVYLPGQLKTIFNFVLNILTQMSSDLMPQKT